MESGAAIAVPEGRRDVNLTRSCLDAVPSAWPAVREWRKQTRADILAQRLALPSEERDRIRIAVCASLGEQLRDRLEGCVGLYWPSRGEIDLRDFLARIRSVDLALPVLLRNKAPFEFWLWRPGSKLVRGIRNALVPGQRHLARPATLFVPLLGFDVAGYRLGDGGGSYDRTLDGLVPKPLTVGVGYEFTRLATIYPQPHDVPMDVIVTEARFQWCVHHMALFDKSRGLAEPTS